MRATITNDGLRERVSARYAGQWSRWGLARDSGESMAKRSATGSAGPWTLLAREAEGPLGQPAGQLFLFDFLYGITFALLHVAVNSTHGSIRSAVKALPDIP